jgi:hypothetical protein
MSRTDQIEAIVDGTRHEGCNGALDITGVDDVEIDIRRDGKVLWVNVPSTVLRIC